MKNDQAPKKKRRKVPESLLLKAIRLLTISPKKGLNFLHRLELTYAPNVLVYFNMGVVLLRLNKLEEAARYFKKTLQLKADYEDARENLGLIARTMTILNKKKYRNRPRRNGHPDRLRPRSRII